MPAMPQTGSSVDDPSTEQKTVNIWTDGSCDTATGHGGWAYLMRYGRHSTAASGYEADTTNNRMELTAAVRALEALKVPSRVRLVTDSQYLKKAFTDGWLDRWQKNGWRTASKAPVKNRDLWEKLLSLERRHQLQWAWTRGHAGHAENEQVDSMALAARRSRRGTTD